MESITITARRRPSRSRVNPSFSGSLPGYPEIDDEWMEGEEGEAMPLPDHFPEPCMDPDQEMKESRSSVTLERGATLVFCPPQQALTSAPSAVTPAPPAVTSAVTSAPPAVTSAVTSAPPAVTSAVTSAPSAVTSAVTSAPSAVTSAVTSATQAVTTAPPAVTSAQQPSVVTKPTLVIPKPEVTFGKKPPPPTSPKPAVTSSSKTPPPTSPKPVVTSCTSPLVRSSVSEVHVNREGQNGAKDGVKRITDKYATPGTLLRNVSVSSSDARPPAAKPKETLPSSPTPSITLTPSPSFFFPNNASAPASHGQSPDSVTVSSAASNSTLTPSDSNVLSLPLPVPGRGSGHSLSSESVSAFSDMSSEMSDSLTSPILRNSVFTSSGRESGLVGTSRYQSVSGIPLTASLGDGVTDQDVQQVEMFYRSHKSEVTVCRCLANLYLGSAASKTSSGSIPAPMNGSVSSSKYSDLWEFVTTGIPLVVQDSGHHHRCRQLTIVLAEKGTGFVLWKDAVNSLSHYSCPDSNFHTLTLSTDAKKLVGLSFDDSKAAGEFGTYITKLTAEMDDDSGTLTRKGKRKKQESKKKVKCKVPKKTDISQPCCFQHITKLERPQITGVMPLPPNSFPAAHGNSVSGLSDIMRDRLSVSSRTHSYSSDLSEACTLASER